MTQSRDDFVIAIRSAFLKKETKQKFSILSLIILAAIILTLSNYNFRLISQIRSFVNEIVYRTAFIASTPEKVLKLSISKINELSYQNKKLKNLNNELQNYRSKEISLQILEFENKKLKEQLNDYLISDNLSFAKIIFDTQSPYLKSFIINKGTKDRVEKGMIILDQTYLVGKVIEVNYSTSRVLMLSDINSNIPITIEPGNLQAILTGSGKEFGIVNFLKKIHYKKIKNGSLVYSSGTGGLIKSGVPIGEVVNFDPKISENIEIRFYSDFSQLKYVSVISFNNPLETPNLKDENQVISSLENNILSNNPEINQLNEKIEILLKEKEINDQLISKLKQTNDDLEKDNEKKSRELVKLNTRVEKELLEEEEIKFLRLNLEYGSKCKKNFFNNLFEVGSPEYKECVLNRGIVAND